MHISLCDSLPENHHFPSIFANLLTASSMAPYIQPIVGILCMLLDSAEENINMVEWQEIRTTVSVGVHLTWLQSMSSPSTVIILVRWYAQ